MPGLKQLIPRHTADNYQNDRYNGRFPAITLFIDISGFTTMTDRLMKEGKNGAEALSNIINRTFTPLIDAVYGAGGFVSSFAGDAFTAIFPEENVDSDTVFEAASQMQLHFRRAGVQKTPWEDFTLQAKIGLGYGEVRWSIFRSEESAGYLYSGPAINECAAAEHQCSPDFITIPIRGRFSVPNSAETQPLDDEGFAQFRPIDSSRHEQIGPLPELEVDNAILEHFLPVNRLPDSGIGEFRDIVSVFMNYEEVQIEPEKMFKQVIRSGRNKGAYLNLIDSGDKGGVLLVLFGAPYSVEQRSRRALEFALEMVEVLPMIRVGVAGGNAFTGYIGSDRRSTYTAMGSVVNLSARLALNARPGTVSAAADLIRGIDGFSLQKLQRGRFKGINKEIRFGILARRTESGELSAEPGIGRDEELNRLQAWMGDVHERSIPEALMISGEAGIGKSQLIDDFLQTVDSHITIQRLTFDSLFQRGFGPLQDHFYQLFQNRKGTDADEILSELISGDLPDYLTNELKRAAPALMNLAGLDVLSGEFSELDVEARYERTLEALVAYFEALFLRSPGILILDQAQSMDGNTRDFLQRLLARNDRMPLCIIYLTRTADQDLLPGIDDERSVYLTPLSDDDIGIAAERELKAEASKELIELVRKRSAGIPLHIITLLRYLRNRGMVRIDGGKAVISLSNTKVLPKTLNDLTISQFDALPAEAKNILPLLAAIGNSFPTGLLEALDLPLTGGGISSLLEAGILERSNLDKLIFRKEFMREAVYEMQLNEVLDILHKRIFDAWQSGFEEKNDFSLEKGYHAEKIGNIAAAREFYLLAGQQAQAVFSNLESVELYYRVIRLDPQNTENTAVRLKIAEIYDLIGQWDNAYDELIKGVGFAILSDMEQELHRFFALGGQVLLQQSRISQAKALLLKAVRDPRAKGINPARIKARIDLARVHLLEGAYSDAMNRLFEARDMSEESDYVEGQGLSSYYLGRLYSVRNKKKEAAVYYTKAQKLFTKLNKPRLIANPLYDLGLLHRNEGKLDSARGYLEKALNIYVQIGYKSGISAALLNIGLIYDQQGEFSQAEDFFHRALNIAREIGEDLAVAYARFCLGAGSYKEGNLEKSLDYLTDAHRLITDLGAETYRGYTLSYLSSLTVRMGRREQAVEYIRSLYDLISSTGEDPEHGRLYLALGSLVRDGLPENMDAREIVERIAESEGIDPPDSVHFYQYAVKISKAAHYVNTLIPALLRLGEQLIRYKHHSAGMKYIRSAQGFAAASGWKNMQSRLEQQYGPMESES